MAIYHCSAKNISRSSGRSSVAAAAYRSGDDLTNERDGISHDYTGKLGVVHSEIIAPEHAPEWATDRQRLWNEVEKIEVAKDARTAREIEVALPKELDRQQQIELTREYAKHFAKEGMVADFSIHDKGNGNPHAHIMLTTRPFNEDGSWGQKAKKEYILDEDGNKQYTAKGNVKSRKIETTDWNKEESLERWRKDWADCANRALEKAGIEQQIDHRSLAAQGVDREPTKHIGVEASAMEKRGERTELGDLNREIVARNTEREAIKKQIDQSEFMISIIDKAEKFEKEKQEHVNEPVVFYQAQSSENIPYTAKIEPERVKEVEQVQKVEPEQEKPLEKQSEEIEMTVKEARNMVAVDSRHFKQLDKIYNDKVTKELTERSEMRKPYLEEAAKQYLEKEYQGRKQDFEARKNDYFEERKELDKTGTFKKMFSSSYDKKRDALEEKRKALIEEQSKLEREFKNDLEKAINGKLPFQTQNKINALSDEIGMKKDNMYESKVEKIDKNVKDFTERLKENAALKRSCESVQKTLSKVKETAKIKMPVQRAGGGSEGGGSGNPEKKPKGNEQQIGIIEKIHNELSKGDITPFQVHWEEKKTIDYSWLAASPEKQRQWIEEERQENDRIHIGGRSK